MDKGAEASGVLGDEEDGRRQPHRREAMGNWEKALRATLPKTELPLGANTQLASCQTGIRDGRPRYADDQPCPDFKCEYSEPVRVEVLALDTNN